MDDRHAHADVREEARDGHVVSVLRAILVVADEDERLPADVHPPEFAARAALLDRSNSNRMRHAQGFGRHYLGREGCAIRSRLAAHFRSHFSVPKRRLIADGGTNFVIFFARAEVGPQQPASRTMPPTGTCARIIP